MATVSKESLAEFWLHAFPSVSSREVTFGFSDATAVDQLGQFRSETDEERKIADLIRPHMQPTKRIRPMPVNTSPKRQRRPRNTLTKIDAQRLRFSVHVDVCDADDRDIDAPTSTTIEDRSLENLAVILHETDHSAVVEHCRSFVTPWLVDLAFQTSNDLFSLLVELMNRHTNAFLIHCVLPWLARPPTDHSHAFFSSLFTHLTHLADRCQLCIYLCENRTCPFNDHQLSLISIWFNSKDFYYSSALFDLLPEKFAVSASAFADSLPFAKVLHKVLIQSTEHKHPITDGQRSRLKQAIAVNTTILSDILLDSLD